MINTNGPMTVCSVSLARTSGGAMQMLMRATANTPPSANGTIFMPCWTGQAAAKFHADNEHRLRPGAQVQVIASSPRPLYSDDGLFIALNVLDIQMGGAAASVAQTKPATCRASAQGVPA